MEADPSTELLPAQTRKTVGLMPRVLYQNPWESVPRSCLRLQVVPSRIRGDGGFPKWRDSRFERHLKLMVRLSFWGRRCGSCLPDRTRNQYAGPRVQLQRERARRVVPLLHLHQSTGISNHQPHVPNRPYCEKILNGHLFLLEGRNQARNRSHLSHALDLQRYQDATGCMRQLTKRNPATM